jgi:6-pyruvoyltetrahydropterin/6-carboxytetrahydropterin synthase
MPTDRPIVRLLRSYRFTAAHHYYDPKLTQAENERLFGKHADRQGHGHDYRLLVLLRGVPDPRTGMLMDLRDLDAAVTSRVLERLDDRNLNLEVEYFSTRQPTTENLAVYVWEQLVSHLPAGLLEAIRVAETDDLSSEYRGETS